MGRTHLRALAGSDAVKVTAIAEMSPAARETVAAPGLTLHESVTDMLDQAALEHGRALEARRATILTEITAQGQLTPELEARLLAATTRPMIATFAT